MRLVSAQFTGAVNHKTIYQFFGTLRISVRFQFSSFCEPVDQYDMMSSVYLTQSPT